MIIYITFSFWYNNEVWRYEMRRIVNDITNGKNIEENLKNYLSEMKALNYKYAMVRLALNYYTYYQIVLDGNLKRKSHEKMSKEIHRVIRDAVLNNTMSPCAATAELDKYRDSLMKEVSALTYYVDAFRIYEHALNRVEYRFRNDELQKDYSDEELCRSLMQYILADEDNVVVNSKISEVITELPIRMTKDKFFEYISNGLSIYKGAEKKSLEDFIYMIRTSSMLGEDESFGDIFPELEETLEAFKDVDYSNIEKNEYEFLIRSIEDVSVYIEDVMNISMILMEIMNDTYAAVLTIDDVEMSKEITVCYEIVANVNDYFILGSEVENETENMFVLLEGSQENLYSKLRLYNVLDEITSSYKAQIKELDLEAGYENLAKLEILASDSIFVELENNSDGIIVDEDILEAEKIKLIGEFKELFSKNGKNINRAVMSSVLAQLPVFFNNISELQDFIYQTLSQCKNTAEKLACIEVLHQIMED